MEPRIKYVLTEMIKYATTTNLVEQDYDDIHNTDKTIISFIYTRQMSLY